MVFCFRDYWFDLCVYLLSISIEFLDSNSGYVLNANRRSICAVYTIMHNLHACK